MNKSSIFATAVAAMALMVPSIVSAAEVTPQQQVAPTKPNIAAAAGSNWVGFAVSSNKRAFKSDSKQGSGAEASARNEARMECERTSLRTCYGIAVPETADISAVGCTYNGRSNAYLGGSATHDQKRIALNKANSQGFPDSSCVEFYTW